MFRTNKIIITIIISSNFFFARSQTKDINILFEKFPLLEKFPIIFDQITLEKIDEKKMLKNKLSYFEIKNGLKDDNGEPFIKLTDTIRNRFYSVGRMNLENDRKAIVLMQVSDINLTEKVYSILYSLIDKHNNTLIFDKLADTYIQSNSIASILLEKFNFIQNNNDEVFFYRYEFENNDSTVNLESYKPSFNEIPTINDLNIKFTRKKVESLKSLIPYKYCIPYEAYPTLVKINQDSLISFDSYFIASKEIKNNRKLVFILNKLKFKNFTNVYEIDYLIVDMEKVLKTGSLSTFYTDLNGKNHGTECEIKDLDKKIVIIKKYPYNSENIIFRK